MADEIKVTLSKAEGVTLATKNKICERNIKVSLDSESLANLIPENIKKGVTILGVVGTHEGGVDKNVYLRYNGKVVQTIDTEYTTTWEEVGQDGAAYWGEGSGRIVVMDNGGSIIGEYAEYYIKDGDTYVTADYGVLVGGSYFDLELTESYIPTTLILCVPDYNGVITRHTFTTFVMEPYIYVDNGDVGTQVGFGADDMINEDGHPEIVFTYTSNSYGLALTQGGDVVLENYEKDSLTKGETYTYYLRHDGEPESGETKTTTVHFLWNNGTSIGTATTDAAEPYLYGGGGWGDGFGIYLGAYNIDGNYGNEPPYDDYFYVSAAYCFTGFSLTQNGELFACDEWYQLTAGETYTFYARHDSDYVDVGGGGDTSNTCDCGLEYDATCPTCGTPVCGNCDSLWHPYCSETCYNADTWTCAHCGNTGNTNEDSSCVLCGEPKGSTPSGGGGTTSCSHNYVTYTILEPSCTSGGTYDHVCSKCGHTYTTNTSALGHNWESTGDPDGDGYATQRCTRCGTTSDL